MAKPLPDDTALGAYRASANSPGVSVPAISYKDYAAGETALAQGGQQLAQGLNQIAGGINAYADYQRKDDQFDIQKRLLDFKMNSELALEDAKRNMPAGGAGFQEMWGKTYAKMADEFVGGKDDKNVPKELRGQIGLALKQHEVMLGERAARYQLTEQDQSVKDGLKDSLGRLQSFVEADPARKDEKHLEGVDLINAAPIPPSEKHRLIQSYAKDVDKTAIVSRLMKAQTKEDYDALVKDLAPNAPDKLTKGSVTAQGTLDFIKRIEGDKDNGWDYRQYSGPYGVKRGAGEKLSLDEAETRLKGEVSEVESALDSKIRVPLTPGQRTALTSLFYNIGTGKGRLDQVAEMINSGQIDKVPGWITQYDRAADGTRLPGLVDRRRQEAMLFASGGTVQEPGDAYSGPYSNLSLSERKALHGQAVQQWGKQISDLKSAIDKQASVSGDGIAPPQHIVDELDARVRAANDPTLSAHYAVMLGKLQLTQNLQKAPPQAAEDYARRMRTDAEQNGATPDQMDVIKHAEKVATAVRKNVDENAVAWAAKTGITVPLADGPPADLEPGSRDKWQMPVKKVQLQQLDFRAQAIDGQLADRFDTAKGVARYYNQPIQVFTTAERDALKDVLKTGGPVMLGILGKIAGQAELSGVDPALVMKEITKDAGEVAYVGTLVANKADPRVLETAAKAIEWRTQLGEKFSSSLDKSGVKADLGAYADLMDNWKAGDAKALRDLAALVYEYDYGKGIRPFDATKWHDTVQKLMGQTKDAAGITYGGVGYTKSNFLGFGSTAVLVPEGVRSDKFDTLIDTLRASDLAKTGWPVTKAGEPVPMSEIRKATWTSIAPGQYTLVKSKNSDGTMDAWYGPDGRPFVMDVRPILGDLRTRRPDLFVGFDRMTGIVPQQPSDPALPSFWTGEPTAETPAPKVSPDRARREAATRMFQ